LTTEQILILYKEDSSR